MTALTFESVYASPRRAAVRRSHRPAPRLAATVNAKAPVAPIRTGRDVTGARYKAGLVLLTALAITLHAAVIYGFRHGHVSPHAVKLPLTIEMAPPKIEEPPPPPVVAPKPLPQTLKHPVPLKKVDTRKPVLPVVRESAVDNTPSENSVQVATTPQPAPPPEPEHVTEPRGYAGYLSNPAPSYPPLAQKRGWEGQVMLKVHVLASGRPDSVTVAKSTGYDVLDQAALKAVNTWMFQPAHRGQTAVDGWVQVPLTFKL